MRGASGAVLLKTKSLKGSLTQEFPVDCVFNQTSVHCDYQFESQEYTYFGGVM